jgi:DNA-nicking Smr family endonuclease
MFLIAVFVLLSLLAVVVVHWFVVNMGACFGTTSEDNHQVVANPSAATHYDAQGQRVFSAEFNKHRANAQEHANLMKSSFDSSQREYQLGNKAEAKRLSDEGKRQKALMEKANADAVNAIIAPQALDRSDTIDLHGLHVSESTEQTLKFVQLQAKLRLYKHIFIITGQGHQSHGANKEHSPVREAVVELARQQNWAFHQENNNAGKFVVSL